MADSPNATPAATPPLQAESAIAAAAGLARVHPPLVQTTAEPRVLPRAMLGEFLGTFVLVFFGVGVVNAAVATGTQVGLWQVAVVWAIGVTLGIYSSAAMSGAHLNPAITLVGVVFDRFPIHRAVGYVVAQVAGAMAATACCAAARAASAVRWSSASTFPTRPCSELPRTPGASSARRPPSWPR